MFGYNTLMAEVELPMPAIVPANYTGSAQTGPWVSLRNYNAVAFVIVTGAWAGGTAAVTVNQAQDLSGTGSKALTLSKPTLYTNTTSTGLWTTAAIVSNTFNLSAANTLYLFEVQARSLDLTNNFLTVQLAVASPGANNDYYSAAYIFRQSSYTQGSQSFLPDPTVI